MLALDHGYSLYSHDRNQVPQRHLQQEGLVEDVYVLNVPLPSPVDRNKPVDWSRNEITREKKGFEGGELFEGQTLSDAQGHSSVCYCLVTFGSTRDCRTGGPVVSQST